MSGMSLMTRVLATVTLMIALLPWSAQATTVLQVSFDELVDSAELVFEGEVLALESYEAGPRAIYTRVRFAVTDVIKGEYSHAEIELHYLGGQVGSRAVQVAEMQLPAIGETGIYFVGSLHEDNVHPLVGWSQGHFQIVIHESGEATVATAAGDPVRRVLPGNAPAPMHVLPHEGHARGVQIQSLTAPEAPLTVTAFKQRIRELVDEAEQ